MKRKRKGFVPSRPSSAMSRVVRSGKLAQQHLGQGLKTLGLRPNQWTNQQSQLVTF